VRVLEDSASDSANARARSSDDGDENGFVGRFPALVCIGERVGLTCIFGPSDDIGLDCENGRVDDELVVSVE
jgi:hypothetical protein